MAKWVVRLVTLMTVVVVALGAVGFAAAQGPATRDGMFGRRTPVERVVWRLIDAAADAAEMTPRELIAAVRDADGQRLSDVLVANGVDVQSVADAVKADAIETINTAVAEGTITEERAAEAISALDDALDTALNSELPLLSMPIRGRLHDAAEHTLIGVLAEMAGADVQDVLRDSLTPPTIAEIAESYGLDADAIIAETETRVTEEVNQQVADGTLTEAQGAAILDGLHDRLVERFDSPLFMGHPGARSAMRPGAMGRTGI